MSTLPEERGPGLPGLLRKLATHSAVYGSADVFARAIDFLLVPLYTAYLSATDYGTLALLILFSTAAKILFRMGLDAGFFRLHYDQPGEAEKRQLAGTVAVFSLVASSLLFGFVVLATGPLNRLLFRGEVPPAAWLILATADVYVGTLLFVPLSLLRIQDRPGLFSALTVGRHTINTLLKVVLVTQGFGVAGVLWSDLVATALFSLALLPILVRHAALAFAWPMLKDVLAFGLPKVPHGFLVQIQNLADRKILDLFVTRAELGIYQMGYTFGTGVKFALSAFEPAWQPFVYSQIKQPGAAAMLGRVVTYAFAAFTATGLAFAVLGGKLLVLMTPKNPAFWDAAPIVPVVTLAYVLHGAFLLGSVGIAIEKRARYYPAITLVAAAVNVGANFALIPHFGILGAAWATVASYAVMAALGLAISQRLYPIPLEWSRLARIVTSAFAVYLLSALAPSETIPALLVKGAWLAAFPALLLVTGCVTTEERAWLFDRLRGRR